MEQRSLCFFLALNGLSARAVPDEPATVLDSDAITYSTVTKYMGQQRFPSIRVDLPDEPATTVFDQVILDALEK
jgi:hypothetical protein